MSTTSKPIFVHECNYKCSPKTEGKGPWNSGAFRYCIFLVIEKIIVRKNNYCMITEVYFCQQYTINPMLCVLMRSARFMNMCINKIFNGDSSKLIL